MNRRMLLFCSIAISTLLTTASSQSFLSQYKGLPYHDTRYQGGPQKIPGRVLCAYYDLGGEGVAYHDTDPKNHGSGELNPADGTYLNELFDFGSEVHYMELQRLRHSRTNRNDLIPWRPPPCRLCPRERPCNCGVSSIQGYAIPLEWRGAL